MIKGYCVKCKRKEQEIVEGKEVITKNGRKAYKGKCPVCGCGMYKFLPKK